MRILVAGAGVAGTAFTALLNGRGHEVTLIERSQDFSHSGYALSLWPLGTRVLIGLGAIDTFRSVASPLDTYHLRNGAGELVNAYELTSLIAPHGDVGTLSRKSLLQMLRARLGPAHLRMGLSIEHLQESQEQVTVTFSDGTSGLYDLVVGADGIHSHVRQLLIGRVAPHETGWGGWIWWAPAGTIPVDDVTEYWGAGRFLGLYPCGDQICVFAGGPLDNPNVQGAVDDRTHLLAHFSALVPTLPDIFDALPQNSADVFFWKLEDVRSPIWSKGRVVLLGDAATAFLPTAGVGASNALESAAVLADELLRVEAATVTRALRLFEKRHRKRVEAAQTESRNLAKIMLVGSTPLAWARDELMKHYSVEKFVTGILKSLDEPI
jgi:FAD-dependent urate hydroxylase